MIIVSDNFFDSTWKSFLIRIQNFQISQNKSVIWKIHYVENIFFVAEVHEDQSLIVYGASLFYWTWKSKLQTLVLQNYRNSFQKKSAIYKKFAKICHIESIFFVSEVHEDESWIIYGASLSYRTWKSSLIPKL